MKRNITFLMLVLLIPFLSFSQVKEDKEKKRIEKESARLLSSASEELESDNFTSAEVDLRKAIAILPEDETGKYNLGNAYYDKKLNEEAMRRFVQAAGVAQTKAEKHKAYHNLGNTFMNAKKYQEAVEAYKNALRNNPTDDETRYNLALAKDLLEKNPPQGGGDDDKQQDKNEDEKEDKKENKEQDGKDKEGDEGDEKEDKDKGDEKDENKEGDKEKDEGKPKDPNDQKEGEGEKPKQQQPVPGQLSPQQIKNLLEAMNNEEKKVQDKINARKQKGAKVKSEKDW